MRKMTWKKPELTVISLNYGDVMTASNEVGFELNDDFWTEEGWEVLS